MEKPCTYKSRYPEDVEGERGELRAEGGDEGRHEAAHPRRHRAGSHGCVPDTFLKGLCAYIMPSAVMLSACACVLS